MCHFSGECRKWKRGDLRGGDWSEALKFFCLATLTHFQSRESFSGKTTEDPINDIKSRIKFLQSPKNLS